MAFAESLKNMRKCKGMTQEELAKRVGIAQVMISKYEAEIAVPSTPVGVALARELGTTVEELMGGDYHENN